MRVSVRTVSKLNITGEVEAEEMRTESIREISGEGKSNGKHR